MKRTVPALIALTMLVGSGSTASTQISRKNFALDDSKPYVYIQFDHAGQREPIDQTEPAQGLWLRLINNSTISIEVETMDTATQAKLMVLPDVITAVERIIPRSGEPHEKMPMGYGSGMGVFRTIAPGDGFIFSVPANHVSPYWYMQVPFHFNLPPVKKGSQPICYAAFTWEDLPASYTHSANN